MDGMMEGVAADAGMRPDAARAGGSGRMVAHVATVAFQGIDVLDIDVQVQMTGGMPAFAIVGLPDKAVGESRERVRAALTSIGLALAPEADRGEPRPGRRDEGGQPLRPAHRPRPAGGDGGAAAGRGRRLHRAGRARARRRGSPPVAGVLPAAIGAATRGPRHRLPGRDGRRGGLGRRHRRPRARFAARLRQPCARRPGAAPAGRAPRRGRARPCPTCATSRGRRRRSGRSRSPRPARTIC